MSVRRGDKAIAIWFCPYREDDGSITWRMNKTDAPATDETHELPVIDMVDRNLIPALQEVENEMAGDG